MGVGEARYYDFIRAEDAELHELHLGHLSRRVREPRVHFTPTAAPPPPRVWVSDPAARRERSAARSLGRTASPCLEHAKLFGG